MRMFGFLRRLFGKDPPLPGTQEVEGRRSAPPASGDVAVVTQEDDELMKKLDRMEQKALERIRREKESDLLLPLPERMKKSLNLPTKLAAADRMDAPFPYVTIVNRAGVGITMDREAFDYMYGESNFPDPAQRDLEEMLARVVRIRVLAGGMIYEKAMEGEVLVDTADAAAVRSFQACLKVVEEPSSFCHCMCLGCPTIELYSSEGLIATIGVHHGRAIRWAKWKHDAALQNGEGLVSWLADRGVSPKLMR
jgi:hypothetical protein